MGQDANLRNECVTFEKYHSQGSEVLKCDGEGRCPQNLRLWACPTTLILETVALKR